MLLGKGQVGSRAARPSLWDLGKDRSVVSVITVAPMTRQLHMYPKLYVLPQLQIAIFAKIGVKCCLENEPKKKGT